MEEKRLNPVNKKENIRLLRRRMRMTQKEFIQNFLSDNNGQASMSVATLSNMEARGGARVNEVIFNVAQKLGIDAMIFSMAPEAFLEKIELVLPEKNQGTDSLQINSGLEGAIWQTVNRLTMYFAEKIFNKELKKGDKIQSDRELAELFGVGRSSLREALKVLAIMGMIDIRPGQGTYISSSETNFFIIPLSWSLFLNGNQIDSIITVRNLLEIKAAELAAQCQKEEILAKLHDATYKIQNSYTEKNYKEFLEGDLRFHISIAECSENQVIYSMIQTISNLMRHVSGTGMVNEEQIRQIYEEHQKIYGCILTHNADDAGKAMKEHLEKSSKRYNYR